MAASIGGNRLLMISSLLPVKAINDNVQAIAAAMISNGTNMVRGSTASDSFTAGAGKDSFVYNAIAQSAAAAADTITGFNAASDVLQFVGLNTSAVGFTYLGAAALTNTGFAQASFASGVLSIDTQGTGTADMKINLASLSGTLSESNFLWF